MSPKEAAKTSPRSTTSGGSGLLTAEEEAAMRETLNERRRARSGRADGESDVLAKIAEMPKPDRVMAERIHAILKAKAPTHAENLVRHARLCEGRQGNLLLPKRSKVQVKVRDVGFSTGRTPR